MKLLYTLKIEAPDGFDVEGHENYDPDIIDEIENARAPHDDTLEKGVLRWLGGTTIEAEAVIADQLPDGWHVSIVEIP